MLYYTSLNLHFAFDEHQDGAAHTLAIAELLGHHSVIQTTVDDIRDMTLGARPTEKSALLKAFDAHAASLSVHEASVNEITVLNSRGAFVRSTALTHDTEKHGARVAITLAHMEVLEEQTLERVLSDFGRMTKTTMTYDVIERVGCSFGKPITKL